MDQSCYHHRHCVRLHTATHAHFAPPGDFRSRVSGKGGPGGGASVRRPLAAPQALKGLPLGWCVRLSCCACELQQLPLAVGAAPVCPTARFNAAAFYLRVCHEAPLFHHPHCPPNAARCRRGSCPPCLSSASQTPRCAAPPPTRRRPAAASQAASAGRCRACRCVSAHSRCRFCDALFMSLM